MQQLSELTSTTEEFRKDVGGYFVKLADYDLDQGMITKGGGRGGWVRGRVRERGERGWTSGRMWLEIL